jgi:hypothetical protein
MSDRVRCTCSRCTIRGLMGPVIITTLGVLFLLSELGHGNLSFGRTFPILLIVIGVVLLGSAVAPMEGHVGAPEVSVSPAAPGPPTNPPTYPGSYTGQGQ